MSQTKKVHPRHLPAVRAMLVIDTVSAGASVVTTGVIFADYGYGRWQVAGVQVISGILSALIAVGGLRWTLNKLQEADEYGDESPE